MGENYDLVIKLAYGEIEDYRRRRTAKKVNRKKRSVASADKLKGMTLAD